MHLGYMVGLEQKIGKLTSLIFGLGLFFSTNINAKEYPTLTSLVRDAPYSTITDEVFDNWMTVRTWILKDEIVL